MTQGNYKCNRIRAYFKHQMPNTYYIFQIIQYGRHPTSFLLLKNQQQQSKILSNSSLEKILNHLQCQNKNALLDSTFNASFLSLFIALNCFILDRTALSIGLSDASPSRSHGCSAETSTMNAKYQTSKKNLNPAYRVFNTSRLLLAVKDLRNLGSKLDREKGVLH